MRPSFISFAVACAAMTAPLHAATVTGTYGLVTGTLALPSTPGSDWAYYATNPPVGGAPTNTSGSGTGTFIVSPLGPGATALTGSGTDISTFAFSFTNGTSPVASSPSVKVTGIRNTLLGAAAVNNGVQMSMSAQPDAGQLNLWVYAFNSTSTLKVYGYDSSGGGTESLLYTQAIVPANVDLKSAFQFVFDYVPTGTNDTLRFEYLMDTNTSASANIGFGGISFTPVPEPGVISCAAVAALSCGFLRRRRMA